MATVIGATVIGAIVIVAVMVGFVVSVVVRVVREDRRASNSAVLVNGEDK